MGKRARPEPAANTFPVVLRHGWLHRCDGSVIEARELFGGSIKKYIGTHPECGCHGGWAGVPIVEYPRIEWNETCDSPTTANIAKRTVDRQFSPLPGRAVN